MRNCSECGGLKGAHTFWCPAVSRERAKETVAWVTAQVSFVTNEQTDEVSILVTRKGMVESVWTPETGWFCPLPRSTHRDWMNAQLR